MKQKPWRKWSGRYQKTWYDVQLHDGTVKLNCWPNAGKFTSHEGKPIHGLAIKAIRLAVKDPFDTMIEPEKS